jgi:hypothetical protein
MGMIKSGQGRARRGFTLVPLALVLWIVLIVIGVALWKKTPPAGYVPAKGVGPGQIGSVILGVLYGGFWVAMVSGIAERKGRAAANLTAVIALGFAAVMMGLSYAGLTKDQRNLGGGARAGGPAGAAPGAVHPGGAGATSTTPAFAPAPGPGPSPVAPAPVASAPAASVPPERLKPEPSTPGSPSAAELRAQEKSRAEEAASRVIGEMEAGLTAAIAEVLAEADKAVPPLASPIAHDLVKIRKRLEELESLRKKAEALEVRLREASNGLEAALREAGVGPGDAGSAAMRWASAFGATQRQFACGSLVRACEKGLEEIGFLKDQFPKWTLTNKGDLRVFEKSLEAKFNSNRFFARTEAERYRELRGRLESGR